MCVKLNESRITQDTPFEDIPDDLVKDIEVPKNYTKTFKNTSISILKKIIYMNRITGADIGTIEIRNATEDDFKYIGDEPTTSEEREEISREYLDSYLRNMK